MTRKKIVRKNDRVKSWGLRASRPQDFTWPLFFLAVFVRVTHDGQSERGTTRSLALPQATFPEQRLVSFCSRPNSAPLECRRPFARARASLAYFIVVQFLNWVQPLYGGGQIKESSGTGLISLWSIVYHVFIKIAVVQYNFHQ